MTISTTNQAKNVATPTNQAKSNALIGSGTSFFGWLFFFTIPGGTENIVITNQSKN